MHHKSFLTAVIINLINQKNNLLDNFHKNKIHLCMMCHSFTNNINLISQQQTYENK